MLEATPLTCAILDDYQGVATTLADWSPLRDRVALRPFREGFTTEDALVAAIADCEIVVIMRERTPFPAALFARLPKLKLLVTSGMRNASIDLAAAKAHGVVVCGTASGSAPPVELTWALILALARRVVPEANALRAGGWQTSVGADLAGRRLGLLGLGKIGTRVARIGQAFGMLVSAWSPNLTEARAADAGVALSVSKAALMAESDVVSLHLVLGDSTRGLVDAAALALMRPHALLINTARAGLVDGLALQAALAEGRIGGAGLDVFEIEPLPADSPWRSLPNLLALPHLGYVSEANYRTYFTEAVADIQGFLDGAPVRVIG
ncbi:Hydroxypyruvate reductase [Methylobacterium cerastii]|uniref:Hydroxypyruvate reductase n=1 Tax=Methylobacterium cerastii TaxID=932741 RepID=A0ABQ4QE55_9HYPH|nr:MULTISPECIES: D-2-hydroxyacid dehydrogenase family protein [Methylobacterium]TXM64069.1 D-2-hydroxyacid dehydrogenase family protein [Methylobacterium sp. WL12]TXN73915.1 D-2-hydroxyacid dehydrogenase family protein [Methylobacterium sp. WL8]GJD43493.1 Hydroxypyruvate reductase [Methylobacterium cerastii]